MTALEMPSIDSMPRSVYVSISARYFPARACPVVTGAGVADSATSLPAILRSIAASMRFFSSSTNAEGS